MRRRIAGMLLAVLVATLLMAAGLAWLSAWLATTEPTVPAPSVEAAFLDRTPLAVTISVPGWQLPWPTTAAALLEDASLWRMMHVADWNRVPDDLREQGLDAMLERYQAILVSPAAWDRMTADDWDRIPQPIRMMAFRHMAAYWAGYYDVGGRDGLAPALVSETIQAIVMSESWFEHRTVAVNLNGTRDLGLAGASDFARARLRVLHAAGVVDFGPDDASYFNPWVSTRFAALWFALMLREAGGDLDRAIGAYNRGIALADDEIGLTYRSMVHRRRTVFIRNQHAPVAWDYLWRRARDIERKAWPWMGPSLIDVPASSRHRPRSSARPHCVQPSPPAVRRERCPSTAERRQSTTLAQSRGRQPGSSTARTRRCWPLG
jgi:hypothetical protein